MHVGYTWVSGVAGYVRSLYSRATSSVGGSKAMQVLFHSTDQIEGALLGAEGELQGEAGGRIFVLGEGSQLRGCDAPLLS
jgi:hypothetical protein